MSLTWPAGQDQDEVARNSRQCHRLVTAILPHAAKREIAVQAGGFVGILPKLLAAHYATVHTFEPDADNFACLERNVVASNVNKHRAALGDAETAISLMRDPRNFGANFVCGKGDIPVMRIDALQLDGCDLIALDIEGYELEALKGAQETIARHRPIIVVEDNGLSVRYGIEKGITAAWLRATLGYRIVGTSARDIILKPLRSREHDDCC